jgi:hypothetical protein
VSFVSWDQLFFDPIKLPGRKPLVTLRDAAEYTMELPEAEHKLPHWGNAIEWLMLVGQHDDDPMVPRIAMMQALHRERHRVGKVPRSTRSLGDERLALRADYAKLGRTSFRLGRPRGIYRLCVSARFEGHAGQG